MNENTRIGCEAYIVRDGKILLGKRGNVAGKGTWALPRGHLEYMEPADEGLIRELKEEMGIVVSPGDLKLLALTDDLSPETGKHYVHITFAVDTGGQEPQLLEPDACEEWRWFAVEEMPAEIFVPHAKIFRTIASKQIYTEHE